MTMEKFHETVLQSAENKKREAITAIEAEFVESVENNLKTVREQANERLIFARHEIGLKSNKEIAAAANHAKSKMADTRKRLTDTLFEMAAETLREFIQSPDYTELFQKRLKDNISETFTQIEVMERDMVLVTSVPGLQPVVTEEDFIGGFRLLADDRRMIADHTLLSALHRQRENFPVLFNETKYG
jgi:vacuolar-type H+-ATPase subunit E/Vma4